MASKSKAGAPEGAPVELPLAALIEDLSIYPRHAVDPQHVSSLVDAIRSGVILPPLVAETGTKDTHRIVDGVHRLRAIRKAIGENATASVILKQYASEADLLLDAIAMNSAHGRRLDRMDQARSVLLAEAAGATVQMISVVLHVPETRVQQLSVRIAYVDKKDSPPIVLKRPAQHFQGQTMTAAQALAHQSMPGTSLLLTARQLRLALSTGLANSEDSPLRVELVKLSGVLTEWLEAHPEEEPEAE